MAGIKALRKMQIGWEATAGTSVSATTIWRGPVAGMEALDAFSMVEEDVGRMGGANRSTISSYASQVKVTDAILTYEQFPWALQSGVEAQQTGVADGAGSGKIYTFDFPLTSANTIKTFTVEVGNNEQVWKAAYCITPEFDVTGAPDEPVKWAWTIYGRRRTSASFTGGLSLPVVHDAHSNTAQLFIDAVSGTIGTTEVEAILYGWTLKVTTGTRALSVANGQLHWGIHDQAQWDIELQVTLRHTNDADTQDAAWLSETPKLLELRLTGPALTTPGTSYSYYTIKFQLPGKWQKFSPIEDRNGNDVITGTFKAAYDPTAALGPKIIVVNEESSYWS